MVWERLLLAAKVRILWVLPSKTLTFYGTGLCRWSIQCLASPDH